MSGTPSANRQEWLRGVVHEFEGRLVRYAARITGDLDRARDVVQETFTRLCAQNGSVARERVAEWLFTVCRNRAVDVRRKECRMTTLAEPEFSDAVSHAPDPSESAETQDELVAVRRVIGTLPENQQEVIRLKFQEGLSYREISRVTGLSESNVGFLIHTGLKTIRGILQKEPTP